MNNNDLKIKPITLEIDKDVWEKFKKVFPRTISLNDALVFIIEKAIRESGEEDPDFNVLK